MNLRNFNKNWLDPLFVLSCLIECRKERKRIEKEEKEYKLKLKQGCKKDRKEK